LVYVGAAVPNFAVLVALEYAQVLKVGEQSSVDAERQALWCFERKLASLHLLPQARVLFRVGSLLRIGGHS